MAIPLDDFDLILGIEFLVKAKAFVTPHLRGMMIGDEQTPYFVSTIKKKKELDLQSGKQFKAGLKKREQTYVAALIEIKHDQIIEVPDVVAAVLEEFSDVMPPKLLKKLPPCHAVDNKIKLELGARSPAKASYRMVFTKLVDY